MIRVERNQKDAAGRPVRPDVSWFVLAGKKTAQAIQDVGNPPTGKHEADKAVYGHSQVRMALTKLFNDKCAYCETPLPEAGWDIEHYRPKGRVTEAPRHPGYFWLAYVWDNLLPACEFCNQKRTGAPTWDHPFPEPAAGKFDQFPLKDENKRVHAPGSISGEDPLLLNPCKDHPEDHFKYTVEGEVLEVGASEKLIATVKICNLRRHHLKQKRLYTIDRTRDILKLMDEALASGHTRLHQQLKDLLDTHQLSDACAHAGVARDVVRDRARYGF